MKILAIMSSYRPQSYPGSIGGGEISNRILLEGLACRGHEVIVMTRNAGGRGDFTEGGVTVRELAGPSKGIVSRVLAALLFSYRILNGLTGGKPDVIVSSTDAVGISLLLRKRIRAPLVVFVRAFENFDKPSGLVLRLKRLTKSVLFGEFGPKALQHCDLLLPNSEFMDSFCRESLRVSKDSIVIYPPLDLRDGGFIERRLIKTVSMVGTSEKKGTDLVERLAKRFPWLEFRVVGCTQDKLSSNSGLPNLTFIGWCNVIEEFSNKADLVLVPSLWPEPFGRVAVEALACGKVALVSDIGGLPEAVGYEALLAVVPGDEEAWAMKIENFLATPEPFIYAAERARTQLSKFSAECQVARLERALVAIEGES